MSWELFGMYTLLILVGLVMAQLIGYVIPRR